MKPLLLNLTTSSAYLSFSMNYECREICPQQINTDSHKNLPKGNAKEEEDIRFLKVHCMCSYLSQTDFIQTLRKLVMAFWLAPRRRLTRKSTRHFPWDQWGRGWSFFLFHFSRYWEESRHSDSDHKFFCNGSWLGQVGKSHMCSVTTGLFKIKKVGDICMTHL